MVLLLDISRLVENLHLHTPTGIDRVEMAYARHFLEHGEKRDLRFVLTWPGFSGLLDSADIRPVIEEVAARWHSASIDLDADRSFQALKQALRAPIGVHAAPRPLQLGASDQQRSVRDHRRMASLLMRSAMRPLAGRTIAGLRSSEVWYVHVSQFRLNRHERFAWLKAANVRGLFMLHDLIPMMHPEYCRPDEAQRHRRRVETMIDRAAVIVANSEFTRQSLMDRFTDRTLPPCEVVPLGISPSFLAGANVPPVQADIPYFVVIGTIEPRKNLEFLLTLWRCWTAEGRAPRARLVVVGRRGWEIENVASLLDRSAGLAPSVIEARSLSDAGMISLLRGSAALLAPSMVEGFGLPVSEAFALGVPVIASDIAAHREVGEGFAEYVSAIDGRGWLQALDDYADAQSERRRQRVAALSRYRPPNWAQHMAAVESLMR